VAALRLYGWSLEWWLAFLVLAQFTLPVWLLVLLPLAIWLPPASCLWHPFVAAVLGALAGALILGILLFVLSREAYLVLIYAPFGALVGGVTALAGALARQHLYDAKA